MVGHALIKVYISTFPAQDLVRNFDLTSNLGRFHLLSQGFTTISYVSKFCLEHILLLTEAALVTPVHQSDRLGLFCKAERMSVLVQCGDDVTKSTDRMRQLSCLCKSRYEHPDSFICGKKNIMHINTTMDFFPSYIYLSFKPSS